MSRNIDKANTVLFRLQEQKAEAAGYIDYYSTARPRAVQKVDNLKDAENWRKQVLKEISDKTLKIQDEKLSDYQIRDLNDELNKLMKEKYTWEYHIRKLGGIDYLQKNKNVIGGGVVIRGYTYFGRAKELKGVKELILKQKQLKSDKESEKEQTKSNLTKLKELEKRIDLKYLGYFDEEIKLSSNDDTDFEAWNESKQILGDLIDFNANGRDNDDTNDTDENAPKQLTDKLLKYERSATKKRIKQLAKIESTIQDVISIESSNPVSPENIQKYLVDRRRKELEAKYNI